MHYQRRNGKKKERRVIMNKKKGQALVEFVIILPIFIFMLLAVIDIGKIIYSKNELESELSDAVELYKNKKTFEEIEEELHKNNVDTILEVKNENNETVTISLKKSLTIVTPGLQFLFSNPYLVEVKRVMSYE